MISRLDIAPPTQCTIACLRLMRICLAEKTDRRMNGRTHRTCVPYRGGYPPFEPLDWEVWPTVRSLKRTSPALAESSSLCDCQVISDNESLKSHDSRGFEGRNLDTNDISPLGNKRWAERAPCDCTRRGRYSPSQPTFESDTELEAENLEHEGWTPSAIANWVRECSTSPSPSDSEPEVESDGATRAVE